MEEQTCIFMSQQVQIRWEIWSAFFFPVKFAMYLNLLSDIMDWYWETH